MPYLALYRKYRPNSFEEMVGQDNVVKVIRNAIINDKVSHAYLFSGPRGTGKTTTAKIIAKMVNCLNLKNGVPCDKCENCLKISSSSDIIEIDAASNNGVDEIREIREKVNLIPGELKYKIYIIDEVHMLTTQAFNALLKTLEEPPRHVIFILATTEYHKIPLTIVSRCQNFKFSKIDDDSMVSNLRRISLSENISVDDSVLYEIARLSDGCCRDAVNLLDQLNSFSAGNINIEQLYEISGLVSYVEFSNLINYILNGESVEIINFCNKINNEGKSIFKFVEEFIFFVRDIISCKFDVYDVKFSEKSNVISSISSKLSLEFLYDLIDYLNDLLNKVKISSYPSILLSVFLLKFVNKMSNSLIDNDKVKDVVIDKIEKNEMVDNSKIYNVYNDLNDNFVKLSDDDIRIRINNAFALASKEYLNFFKEKWSNIDNYLINSSYISLNGILKDCLPVVASKEYLVVMAKYDSLVDRFNSIYVDIEKFLYELFGYKIFVVAITNDLWIKEKENYIKNLKNGVKYNVIPVVYKNTFYEKNTEKNVQSDLDVLKDLVGNDIIKYVD